MILIAAGLLTLATACSALTGTPTPRPTYTPYPTYTPVPPLPLGTTSALPTPVAFSQADPTGVPLLELGTTSALPTPTISPDRFREVGKGQQFFGDTWLEFEKARQAFGEGRYQDALEGFLEAQLLHGEPSGVIQNWIGNSYRALGQSEAAIQHFTNAIQIEDDPVDRVNRGLSFIETGRCEPAIEDAKAALTMERITGDGYHTDAEANHILASCYAQQGDYLLALQHAEAALEIAEENHYSGEELEAVSLTRETIQAVLDGREEPENLLFEPALTYFTTGIELLGKGNYQEAIISLKRAQEVHGQPYGDIQTWIGEAYSAMGQHETAIKHYTDAIDIRDDAYHRIPRAIEYANNGRCAEATTDAETALAMEPYHEPGYHTSAEAHWTLAACSPEEQAQVHMDQAVAIARAHGYSEEDIAAISAVVDRRETSMVPDEIITTVPVVRPGQGSPTAPVVPIGQAAPTVPSPKAESEKTSLTSITDLQNAKWLQGYHPETADRVAQLPWVRDGLNAQEEEKILDDLLQILTTQSRSGVIMLSGRVNKTVDSILDMPFIQSISPGDALAIRSLRNIANKDTAKLKTILAHPTFAGGITDEWTPVIAVLRGPHEKNPSLIPILLDPRKTSIESRTIELPIMGSVDLNLIRMGSDRNPKTMDTLEEIVKNVEFFMHLPLPLQTVNVLIADSIIPSASGNNFGTGITIRADHERDNERLTDILAHEVAHYYWSGNQEWIDEGMSDLIENYHSWQTTGVPMTASRYPCPHFSNIQQLEKTKPRKGEDSFSCNYTLGERIFLDLWLELGDVPFREGAQRLYEQTRVGDAGVEEVRAAFNRPETVERWYSSAKAGTVRGIDENEPTWKLDEIHGTIDDAGIILAEGKAKVESFSARSHRGEAFLWFSYSHPTFVEESWTVDLTLVEIFEDGFIYKVNPLEMNIQGTNVGGNWRISVGPGNGKKWKPGVHHVMLYDRGGTKVAHVSWNVTP